MPLSTRNCKGKIQSKPSPSNHPNSFMIPNTICPARTSEYYSTGLWLLTLFHVSIVFTEILCLFSVSIFCFFVLSVSSSHHNRREVVFQSRGSAPAIRAAVMPHPTSRQQDPLLLPLASETLKKPSQLGLNVILQAMAITIVLIWSVAIRFVLHALHNN